MANPWPRSARAAPRRGAGIALLLGAVALVSLRLWTGIVYRMDEPVAAFVLKRSPDPAIERAETVSRPLERDFVIDEEEPGLVYGALYVGAMRAVPVAVPALVVGAVGLLARRRRPRVSAMRGGPPD